MKDQNKRKSKERKHLHLHTHTPAQEEHYEINLTETEQPLKDKEKEIHTCMQTNWNSHSCKYTEEEKKVNQENSTKHKNLHIKLRMLLDGEEEGGGGQETNKHECEH